MGLLAELKRIIDDESRVIAEAELEHGRGFGYNVPSLPEVVVFPKSREEIVRPPRFRHVNGVPWCRSDRAAVWRQVAPLRGGISLDTRLMNRVLEVRPDDFLARVEAGVTHGQLNARLQEHGLFFPVDPGWDASFGGMAATNASGTNAVRYGTMRDQVDSRLCSPTGPSCTLVGWL